MGREKVALEAAPVAASAPTPEQTEYGDEPQIGQAGAAARAPRAAAAGPAAQRSVLDNILGGLRSHPLVFGAVLGLVALGAVVLFQVGLPGNGGAEEAPPADQAGDIVPLDTERIAELTAAVEADPNNLEALFELGESYFQAGEWQSAIDWFSKLVAIEPNNVHALTDIGTSNYNLGFAAEAKAAWLKALEFDPNDAQVHYNLGFLYANSEPQDLAAAIEEWQKVVELAPDSNLAQTVQVHLEGLANSTPEASPEASPAAP
jgi:cytochrome c-type biogenesis protein CcmH/NrfG